jgi:NADPH:quinone reductase-like Zn-dependent oxidoreductase
VEPTEVDAPRELAADEIRIAVVAAGVGNWDELVRRGSWRVGGVDPWCSGLRLQVRSSTWAAR